MGLAGQGRVWGGGGLPQAQHGLCPPGNKIPDLPGAVDEPFDKRFIKWMIKEKVGWASARALLQGCTHFKEWGAYLVCTEVPHGLAGKNSRPLRASVLPSVQ